MLQCFFHLVLFSILCKFSLKVNKAVIRQELDTPPGRRLNIRIYYLPLFERIVEVGFVFDEETVRAIKYIQTDLY